MISTAKPDIRLAMPSDAPALLDLLRAMHEEAGYGTFSEQKASIAIDIGLRREAGMIGVIRGKRGLEGSIGLFLQTPTFSEDAVLSDLWLIVDPAHRRSANAKSLIEFAKYAATELGRPLMMSAVANESTARKVELLGRQLKNCGSLFLYDPRVAA